MKLDRFINRPVLSTVISIFMVILGVIGLVFLPITQYPDIAPPTIQVSTTYTGANAQTILNSVIAPLEESICRLWCGKHAIHDFYGNQYRIGVDQRIF